MRTSLAGEGVHEVGDGDGLGALQALIGRLAPNLRIEEVRFWKDRSVPPLHGRGGGFYKRALRWVIRAREDGFDALVLVVDEDGDHVRSTQFATAQDDPDFTMPRALGVAVRTFDAWMLADTAALSHVLERVVDTQPEPEGIADPKDRIKALIDRSPVTDAQRTVYAQIAGRVSIPVLEERCPRGFATFAERVRKLSTSP